MRIVIKNRLSYGIVGLYLILAVVILFAADKALMTIFENVKTIQLSRHARTGMSTIDTEIADLTASVESSEMEVRLLSSREYPTLQDIERLQSRHHLRLLQTERVDRPSESRTDLIQYNATLVGSIGSIARFLKSFEDEYVVRLNQANLRAADDEGKSVALTISLFTKAE